MGQTGHPLAIVRMTTLQYFKDEYWDIFAMPITMSWRFEF